MTYCCTHAMTDYQVCEWLNKRNYFKIISIEEALSAGITECLKLLEDDKN